MLFTRPIKGGFFFGRLSGTPSLPIVNLPLPDKVIVPLKQGYCAETQCLVKKGERVIAGQIIARDDHTYSSPVHATVSGTVENFIAFSETGEVHHGVIIRTDPDYDGSFIKVPGAGSPDLSVKKISEILYLAGVTALGSRGIPSLHHTSDLSLSEVRGLLIKGFASEPYSLAPDELLAGRVDDFFTGVLILSRLFGLTRNIHVAVGNNSGIYSSLVSAASRSREPLISVHGLKPVYPLDMDEIAVEAVLGQRVPDEGSPSDLGIVVLDIQDVLHVHEAVIEGKPLIERVVALGGPGYSDNSIVRARVGTPMENLLLGRVKEGDDRRILVGGALRGVPIESPTHPVERTFSAITVLIEDREREFLSFARPGLSSLSYTRSFLSALFRFLPRTANTNTEGELRPCIYCGYCSDACPRSLIPHIFARHVSHGMNSDNIRYGILSCIECGLCSFVCPSKIELTDMIKSGKRALGRGQGAVCPAPGMRRLSKEEMHEASDT